MRNKTAVLLAAAITLAASPTAASASPPRDDLDDLGPANPHLARDGSSTRPGPGAGPVDASLVTSGAVCPTVLLDRRGYPVAYCVEHATRHGELRLLDPGSLAVLASVTLPPGGRPGGLSLYLDDQDRAVLGDGAGHVLRVAHSRSASGAWTFRTTDDWDVGRAVTAPDHIESLTPDFGGRVWFSSANGTIGTVTPQAPGLSAGAAGTRTSGAVRALTPGAAVRALTLPRGETVANAISSARAGVAVASDHALYLMRARPDGTPTITARLPYDRGPAQKPGRLSRGTGTAPSFFGRGGDRYLAIADNAVPRENLLVYRLDRTSGAARRICRVPLFAPGRSAAGNAPVAVGHSVIVPNAAGYNYRIGDPPSALPGGLTRVDVRRGGEGCDVAWTNPVPSAAAPRLSLRDGRVYTVQRTMDGLTSSFALAVVDASTGRTVRVTRIGSGMPYETFQLPGLTGPSGVLYQPTVSGILRIAPREKAERRFPTEPAPVPAGQSLGTG